MSETEKKARIMLVDDHPAILRQTIQLLPERFDLVGISEDGSDLQDTVHEVAPDILVLDITLPLVSGVELARRLRASGCEVKIVFLTVHADPDYAWEAFEVGASSVKPWPAARSAGGSGIVRGRPW